MIKWIKKKILKSVIKDILKDLPSFKEETIKVVEIYADEFLDKCKEQIKKSAKEFFVSKITNHSKD
jgi:hypothetical protein